MDPLSISAALVAFLGASGSCAKILRRVIHNANHAPDEILALSNEISDINILLSDIEATARFIDQAGEPEEQSTLSASLQLHMTKAKSILLLLETLASDLYAVLPDGRFKFQKLKWMQKKSTVLALKQDLVDIKRSLNLILSSTAASSVVRIQLRLREMQVEISRPPNSPADDPPEPLGENANHTIQVVQEANVSGKIHGPTWPRLPMRGYPPTAQTTSLAERVPNVFDPAFPTLHSEESFSKMMETVRQIAQFGAITFHLNRVVRCHGNCECVCHSRSRLQTPNFLNRFFGQLFIGYAGLPIWTRDCDRSDCTNHYSRAFQVSYTFPGWLLSRTVDITAAMTYTNEPHFGLKIRNRIQNTENSVFSLARNGNLPGIKDLYVRRLVSPNDLEAMTGQTALHLAIESTTNIETANFLLDVVGVDAYLKDDFGLSAAHHVSNAVLSKPKTTRAWDCDTIFSKIPGDHSEIWDFTYLHSLVVGIHHSDLDSTLLNPRYRNLLDTPDAYGRTPLFWAALRGDLSKVTALLAAGADHSKTDLERRLPLHAAIQSGSVRCVEILLRRGSSVHARDNYGNTALQIATFSDDNEAMLEALYLAGASVNATERYGTSVLASAACLNHPKSANWLIQKGADIESLDVVGYSPLLEAIRYCNAEVAEALLRHGARVDVKTNGGRTVLHVLASTGNLAGTNVLLQFPLPGLSTEIRDSKGMTALQIFENRVGPPDGMQEAFFKLLHHINSRSESEDNEEDVFVDAVASLTV